MIETPVKSYCRAVGIFLILTIIGGFFGEVFVPSRIWTPEVATTIANLRQNDSLFRLGFAAYLVEAFSDVVLAWLFYVLLRPVHRDLALLSAFFGLVSMTLFAVTQMFYFSAPMLLRSTRYLAAFSPAQMDALAHILLTLYATLSGLFMLFYGTGWILRGYLTFRSTYLPRWLGLLMILAGSGFFAKNVTKVLAPSASSDLLLAPMFLNAVAIALWMLLRGIDPNQWDRVRGADPERSGAGRPTPQTAS